METGPAVSSIDAQLEAAARSCAERQGAQVIALSIRGGVGGRVVEVFVDAAQGITTERCSAVSRDLKDTIETMGLLRGSYRLEVSSPGIDRPLKFPWQYPKHVGRQIEVAYETESGTVRSHGTLLEADESGIVVGVGPRMERLPLKHASLVETRVKAPW